MIVSPLWFSLSCFVFPFLVLVLVLCVRVCLFAAVLSVLWSAWWGLWAEALVVQKSGSSSVLAEGKPESCGKMLQLEWLVWQLRLYMLQTMVWNCHSVFVLNRVTAKEFSWLLIIVTLSYSVKTRAKRSSHERYINVWLTFTWAAMSNNSVQYCCDDDLR